MCKPKFIPSPTKYCDGTPVEEGKYSASLDSNKFGNLITQGFLHGLNMTKEEIEADLDNPNPPYNYHTKFDEVINKLKKGEYDMRFVMDTEYYNIKNYKKDLMKYDYKDTSKTDCPQYGDVTVQINTLEELLQLKYDVDEDIYIGNNDNGFDITIMDEQGEIIQENREKAKTKMNLLLDDVGKIITDAVEDKKVIESLALITERIEKFIEGDK